MRPDFLIIGAQKAGSTNFWWMLDQHPEISMTPRKELHYFQRHVDYPDHEWYRNNFVDDGRITGEATPSYCFWPGAIERIYKYNPDIKLIMILRDPVKRAISQYWMEFQGNHEHLSIEDALVKMSDRQFSEHSITWQHILYHHSYLERGIYHVQLDRVLEFFPKEQLYVELLEQLIAIPSIVMEGIVQFLDLDDTQWNFSTKHARNEGKYPETQPVLLNRLYHLFETPNRMLKEKYGIETEMWRLNNA